MEVPFSAEEAQKRFVDGSPYSVPLHIRVTKLETGCCEIETVIRSETLNSLGGVHGGYFFSVMDITAGITGRCTERGVRELVTSSSSCYFLSTAKVGERVISTGRLVRSGRSTGLVDVEIRSETGRILTKAEFTVFYTDQR